MEKTTKVGNAIAYSPELLKQRTARSEARLRRVGRGRKRQVSVSSYRFHHEKIFGETDLFKNLAKGDKE